MENHDLSRLHTILLRIDGVVAITGDANSTTYEKIRKGLFPPPIKLNNRSSAWPSYEVHRIVSALIAGATSVEIKLLVKQLIKQRKQKQQLGEKS